LLSIGCSVSAKIDEQGVLLLLPVAHVFRPEHDFLEGCFDLIYGGGIVLDDSVVRYSESFGEVDDVVDICLCCDKVFQVLAAIDFPEFRVVFVCDYPEPDFFLVGCCCTAVGCLNHLYEFCVT